MFKDIFNNKKVLVTGDSGFKGSWLAIWLNHLGAKVYGYSLPPRTEKDNFVATNLDKFITHIDGDIRDFEKFFSFVQSVNPEIIFHLAAQPIVLNSYKNPKYTFETNLMGTVNLFEAVRKTTSVKVAINITSDKCYKNNEWVWGYRENDPLGGKDPYSASKAGSEIITNAYITSFFSDKNAANIASVRAGNVIGGGDWAEYRIVPDFFRSLKSKTILELRYPEATRPWQHVLEPLSGYLLLAKNLLLEGKKFSGGWNFGPLGTTNQSVRALVEKIIEFVGEGSYSAPEYNKKFYEAGLLNLDISKAIHSLKWKPVLNFEETVKMTVEGYLVSGKIGFYENRVKQIEEYYNKAKKEKNNWTE